MLDISRYIGNDRKKFFRLMELFLGNDERISQRAAWVLSFCHQHQPDLFEKHDHILWENLRRPVPVAVKRNTLRIFQYRKIPRDLQGLAADICFRTLADGKEAVANKVFAMTVLANITEEEPELANELRINIEEQMPLASPGFISRGKKILRRLEQTGKHKRWQ